MANAMNYCENQQNGGTAFTNFPKNYILKYNISQYKQEAASLVDFSISLLWGCGGGVGGGFDI